MHRFDIKTIQNLEIRRKTFKTTQTNESDQIIMHCIDLTSKRSKLELRRKTTKWSNYSALHRLDVKTIKNIEVRSQNIQNNANQRKWSNYNALHRFYIKTIQNVEIRRKTFKTTQTNESDQIIMHCINLTSKRSKLLSFVTKRRKW